MISRYFIFVILLLSSFAFIPSHSAGQGGHGPVFTMATPTLGQGELSFDAMAMSVRQGKNAWMLRQNWHYGLTEDIQLNLSVPTPLRQISNPPQGRLGTLMGTYGDLEASGLFRFFKTYPGGGKRFESTLLLSGSVPTEKQRRGIQVGPSFNAGLVTGYASRTIYGWLGGGYQYYGSSGDDQLGDISYLTAVFGYRPPLFQHDYPKPDWRVFLDAQILELKQTVYGMDCAPCAHGLENRISNLEGVESATVSLNNSLLQAKLKTGNKLTLSKIMKSVEDSGFQPKEAELKVEGTIQKKGDSFILETSSGEQFLLTAKEGAQIVQWVEDEFPQQVIVTGKAGDEKTKNITLIAQAIETTEG